MSDRPTRTSPQKDEVIERPITPDEIDRIVERSIEQNSKFFRLPSNGNGHSKSHGKPLK